MTSQEKATDFFNKKIKPHLAQPEKYKDFLIDRERWFFGQKRKAEYFNAKMELAKKVSRLADKIPFLVMMAVTGSVATGWPRVDDDIDFLVVCKNQRLWLCRIWLFLVLGTNGFKIRTKDKNSCNGLCFNLWLEEESLTIDKKRQNILTALDAVWMVPVLARPGYPSRFFIHNPWMSKYVKVKHSRLKKEVTDKNGWKLGHTMLNTVNRWLFWCQYIYMKRKIKKEIVGIDKAYFHPRGRIDFDKMG